jgi:putative hydrolase
MNHQIAQKLIETADLLDGRGGNLYRVHAYRMAADRLIQLTQPIEEIYRQRNVAGVREALNVGSRMTEVVCEAIVTGRLRLLDRLRRAGHAGSILESVPGLGPVWAKRIHHDLGIATLEDLEIAAYDGRLEHVAGMGTKRLAGIRDSLASRLGRARPSAPPAGGVEPSVAELLEIDSEYREAAAAGRLKMIAPSRFNAHHEAWLPILHTQRGDRRYTALYSNTARAHAFNRTQDWVVIYQDTGRTYTVISSQRGPLEGHRIVTGREPECASFYEENMVSRQLDSAPTIGNSA